MKATLDFELNNHNINIGVGSAKPKIIEITVVDNDMQPLDINAYSSSQLLDISVSTDANLSFNFAEYIVDGGGSADSVYTDKVYFKKDVLCAGEYTQVGNIVKPLNDTLTLATKGKTLDDFINMIFTKEIQPSKTEPSVNITFSQAGSYEVGHQITPSYSASLSSGSYTYGPVTGVVAESWDVNDTNGNNSTKNSDSFNSFTVLDNTNYSITVKATHNEGAIAVTNLGNDSNPIVKIEKGTKNKTSNKVTGYRSYFYGVVDTDSSVSLTTDIIRGLTNGGNYNSSKTFTVLASTISNPKRIVIAIPHNSTRVGLKQVLLTSAFDTDITAQYKKIASAVNVEGYNHYSAIAYDVWVYEPAKIDSGEIHSITLG